jgi:hypothetical protein
MSPGTDINNTLGRLLLHQSEATLFRSFWCCLLTFLCWGLALVVLVTRVRADVGYVFPLVLISIGALSMLTIPFGLMKYVGCHERGLFIRKVWKSRTGRHRDIVAVQFLAVAKYNQGIYEGTICHFQIIPCAEDAVKLRIWGSRRDSRRIWNIVQIILKSNPEAKLLEWN